MGTNCIVIQTNGSAEIKDNDGYESLTEIVGGYLEAVLLPHQGGNAVMYLNEEGKNMLCREHNAVATRLAHSFWLIAKTDYIVGAVVIVGYPDDLGNDTNPPSWVEEAVKTIQDSYRLTPAGSGKAVDAPTWDYDGRVLVTEG